MGTEWVSRRRMSGVCAVLSSFSCVRLFATPWTVAHQTPLSMGSSRQECWSVLPFPFPGDLPNPGIKPMSHVSHTLAGGFFSTEPPGKPMSRIRDPIQLQFSSVQFSSVQFCRSVMSYFLQPHGMQHASLACPSPTPGAYSNSCPSSR